MKEIKFRGRTKEGQWVYGYFIRQWVPDLKLDDGTEVNSTLASIIVDEHSNAIVVKEETVTQFTGIYDSKGTPIYEGDILIGLDGSKRKGATIVAYTNDVATYIGYQANLDLSEIGDTEELGYWYYGNWGKDAEGRDQMRLEDALIVSNLWDIYEPESFESCCLIVDTFNEFRKHFQ